MRPALLLPLLAALALGAAPAFAAGPAEPTVLRVEASGFQREGALAMHAVAIDEAAARAAIGPGRVLRIPHPEGGTLAYRYLRHVEHGEGRFTWIGRSVAEPMVGREAVLSFGGGVGVGPLPLDGGGTLRLALEGGRNVLIVDEAEALGGSSLWGADGLRPAGVVAEAARDDAHEAARAAELAALDAGLAPDLDGVLATPPAPGADPATSAESPAIVEVLLLYTPELSAQAGGDAAALTLMQNRLELANTALANSGVIHRFRAVGSQRLPLDDSSATALANDLAAFHLAGNVNKWPFPFARRVLQLRYRFGADVVAIGRAASARSGICVANSISGLDSINWTRSHNAGHVLFSEGQVNGVLCPEISLANGLGFAMGQDDDSAGRAHSYGRGWSFEATGSRGFYTLMQPITATRDLALLYSTPLLSLPACKSSPCGTASNDSARSLAQTMPLAAAWVASTSDRVFDIQGTRGHVDLPAITPTATATITQWRAATTEGVLTVTGPTQLVANQPYVLRVAYDRLALVGAPIQVAVEGLDANGLVRVTSAWQFRRPTTRADIHASERYVFMDRTATLLVRQGDANEAESRIFFDVPPNATSVSVTVTSVFSEPLEAHLRLAEANDGPTSALLPSTLGATGATLSDTGTARTKVLTLTSGNGLAPGRWNLVLVAPGTVGATPVLADVRVSYVHSPISAIPAIAGQYFNPNRDGHGVFIDRAGSDWIGVWYAYREDGSPTFYYLQGAAPTTTAPQFIGTVYRVSFNGATATVRTIGDISFTPTSATGMTMSYNIDGESGSEPMVRLGGGGCPVFSGTPLAGTGHWFSPSLSGFGYSAQLEPTQEIYAAYLYDREGRPTWQLAQGAFQAGAATTSLGLRQYRGSCPLCGYRPTTSTSAGTLTRTFGPNADGQRGLTNMRVNTTLGAPLVGTWLQDRPTTLLSTRITCP